MKSVADKNEPTRTAARRKRRPMAKEAPLVKPIRTREGFLMLPVKISPTVIRSALRADRDARRLAK